MKGLRTQETDKFKEFFKIVQAEAERQGMIFFVDAGDGNEFETPTMEGEILMGWLVPKAVEQAFEQLWKASEVDDSWSDMYKWAVWSGSGDNIRIAFE